MLTPQFNLDLNKELIIDNFAGGGGASTGIELALGRHVDIAINHDPEAVALHTANHPQTEHYCESVWEIDPLKVTQGRPVGLVWLSPDCKHFSKAKGGKPVEKKIRGLAWVALRWAAKTKPRVIMLENVEEFQTWGPLVIDADGNARPCPKRKGNTFRSFVNALKRHGYQVEWKELRASDYGTPTIRKRLFLIARRDGRPIIWPEPTHGDPGNILTKQKKLKPWRTAAECIDWSLPCPSIFERTKPLAEATCRRIAKGLMRYVVTAAKPYIVNTANSKTTGREPNTWDIEEPLRTITSAPGFALVAPTITEHANSSNPRSWSADDPLRTQCAQVKGGHFALVSAFLAKHYGGVVGTSVDVPASTVTTVDHHSLVTSNLVKLRNNCVGQDHREPLDTVTTGGHFAEVRAFLIKYYGTDQDPNLNEPLHTITTKDRYGLVTVEGQQYQISDIGMRMLSPRELYRAQGFPESYIIDLIYNGKPLTKTAQVRMAGNSVCPPLAAALVRANVPELAIRKAAA